MSEAQTIADALAQIAGVGSVTRGWPRQTAVLPCIAVGLEDQSAADTRDNAAYLTRHTYGVRIFAPTMDGCEALRQAVTGAMEVIGYALERAGEIDGETAQLKMTFYRLV